MIIMVALITYAMYNAFTLPPGRYIVLFCISLPTRTFHLLFFLLQTLSLLGLC